MHLFSNYQCIIMRHHVETHTSMYTLELSDIPILLSQSISNIHDMNISRFHELLGLMYSCNILTKFSLQTCNSFVSFRFLYRIMQIVRGGKLSRFSRISLQSQMFSSENFFLVIRCFLNLKCRTAGQGSGPGLLRYFKP